MTLNIKSNKLGEIRFSKEGSNVQFPSLATIISARETAKRDENNNIIENTIAKIVLECVNAKTLQIVLAEGGDISDLATFTVEIVDNEDAINSVDVAKIVGQTLDLNMAKIALKWVQRNNSGTWGGLKLVINSVKLAELKK